MGGESETTNQKRKKNPMSNIISSFITKIFEELTGLSAAVWNFLEPILKSESGKLLGQILPLTETVVLSLAPGTQDGAAKRASAFSQITSAAESAGIAATTSIINTAIELSVQKLATAPVAAPVAAPAA